MNTSKSKPLISEKTINPSAVIIVFILLIPCACTGKRPQIEKKIENGVEVIINHIEPYKIEGEPSSFTLREKMTISQERADLIEKGMMSMGEFDVDHEGNIYVVGWFNEENRIFKLDRKGNYVTSFARKGQGPGELEMPYRPGVIGDKIAISDRVKKIVFYDGKGQLIKEKKFRLNVTEADVLENGKYLFFGWLSEYKTYDYALDNLSLFDSDFRKIKDLDVYKRDYQGTRYPKYFMWRVTNGHIYIINEERGYEILVYDLEGNLVRKIRKKYRPVSITKKFKKRMMGPDYIETDGKSSYLPDPLPPINSFFNDDEGRLFVMTYEEGDNPGEFLYDIFNPEGIFVGRTSLKLPWIGRFLGTKHEMIKDNLFYCYREKESGFKELAVYEVHWQ